MSKAMWLGVTGGLLYAATGAYWGMKNAEWFGLERDARWLQAGLGVGAALVILGFRRAGWGERVRETGRLGRIAVGLLVAGAVLNVVGSAIQFAIFGTVALGFGLVALAITAFRHRLGGRLDRWLIAVSAFGSLTWNTETLSVWLLVGVGLVWVALSVRLLGQDTDAPLE